MHGYELGRLLEQDNGNGILVVILIKKSRPLPEYNYLHSDIKIYITF